MKDVKKKITKAYDLLFVVYTPGFFLMVTHPDEALLVLTIMAFCALIILVDFIGSIAMHIHSLINSTPFVCASICKAMMTMDPDKMNRFSEDEFIDYIIHETISTKRFMN